MRTFAIPTATLTLSLATACGPGLTPLDLPDGEDTGDSWPPTDTQVDTNTDSDSDSDTQTDTDSDTQTDTDSDTQTDSDTDTDTDTGGGSGVAGNWTGTLLENSYGPVPLPYTNSGFTSYGYSYTVNVATTMSLTAQVQGTMEFQYTLLYDGIPYDYSYTYSCSGSALSGSSYNITMQSSVQTLNMQCALSGVTLDCSSTGANPLRLVFRR